MSRMRGVGIALIGWDVSLDIHLVPLNNESGWVLSTGWRGQWMKLKFIVVSTVSAGQSSKYIRAAALARKSLRQVRTAERTCSLFLRRFPGIRLLRPIFFHGMLGRDIPSSCV